MHRNLSEYASESGENGIIGISEKCFTSQAHFTSTLFQKSVLYYRARHWEFHYCLHRLLPKDRLGQKPEDVIAVPLCVIVVWPAAVAAPIGRLTSAVCGRIWKLWLRLW